MTFMASQTTTGRSTVYSTALFMSWRLHACCGCITLSRFFLNICFQGPFCACSQPMRDEVNTVTSSLIDWAHTQNDPCFSICILMVYTHMCTADMYVYCSLRVWIYTLYISNPRPYQWYNLRAHSRFVPSQWETTLLCNDVSQCLGSNQETVL